MRNLKLGFAFSLFFSASFIVSAHAEPVQRSAPAAGSVIARKIGEEVRFVDVSDWRYVDLKQDLLDGDILRTNATGQLAILFSDHTQVRLGRNSTMIVKKMAASGNTVLDLQAGSIWARAERGGTGLTVQTPAAAAAIRGTDWTLSVNGNQTSLNVLEGKVELTNPQGSVQVTQGEGAVAILGQAPRKVVIVNRDDREQMLFYLTLRNAFTFMPASPLANGTMQRTKGQIEAILPQARTSEDWLTLAEINLSLDSRQKTLAALSKAQARGLNEQQKARAQLILALIAGAENRYADAEKFFRSAETRLDSRRQVVARYGSYYTRSLLHPDQAQKLPVVTNSPEGAVLRAYTAGFLQDIPTAIQILKEAESQYPKNATIPAFRANLAFLLDDRAQVEEAVNKSLSIDPAEPYALSARAQFRLSDKGDLDGALSDLETAIKIAPGSSGNWNALGLLHAERGDVRGAEAAFQKAIELDPQDPVSHANLAVFYLDNNRIDDAKREIDIALAIDPAFDIALVARGRYYLQTNQNDKALDDILAGTVANPAYSQGQTVLATAYYNRKDRLGSSQALDNAERLDKNDAVISSIRTAIDIDDYNSDGAIKSAQDFLRKSRMRGGNYASLGANQDAGSTLNNAFRLQGLNAWGQYYGDIVFDPFNGSSYADQSVRGSVSPLANSFVYGGNIVDPTPNASSFSSYIQGLLFDPHMLSGRSRAANLLRSPFLEGSVGVGATITKRDAGLTGEAEIQGFSNKPIPASIYANFQWQKIPDSSRDVPGTAVPIETETKLIGGTAYITASPTLDDRLVAYVDHNDSGFDFGVGQSDYGYNTKLTSAGLGWSHTFGYENVLNTALFYSALNNDVNDNFVAFPFEAETVTKQENYIAAINHTYGADNLTWRYGAEGGWINSSVENLLLGFPVTASDTTLGYGKVYIDVLHDINPNWKAEYGLFATTLQGDNTHINRLDPRVGLAWTPIEGHWLRAGFIRQTLDINSPTLAPIGVVGLQPNQFATGLQGYSDTLAARWDAEWNDWLFTALDFQHQEFHDASIAIPLVQDSLSFSKAEIDRAAFTTNVALGHGFGVAATYALLHSENKDPSTPGYNSDLIFVPQQSGQIALTWVNEVNVKATLAANYTGKRVGTQTGIELDDYWTLDANLMWEPFDKRFALELAGYNLLDKDFEVKPGIPGWGRAVKGTFKVRF